MTAERQNVKPTLVMAFPSLLWCGQGVYIYIYGHVWVGNSLIITNVSYFHDTILHKQLP